jgi:excisionase family DNA binding protein
MPGSTEWLTYPEAAARLGTTVQGVQRLVRLGGIEAQDRRIRASSVEDYIRQGHTVLPGVFRRLIVQLPPDLAERLRQAAQEQGISMSEIIRQVLREALR